MAQDFSGSIAEIVNTDYRTGKVFKKYNINYCCGGGVSLSDTCNDRNIDYPQVMRDLKWATRNIVVSNNLPFDQWELNFLIDYIVNIHHTYLYLTIPILELEFISFLDGHEKQFPEIKKVQITFTSLCSLLLEHNKKEDEIVFPYIKQIGAAVSSKESYGNLFVRTLRKPFTHIQSEHQMIEKLAGELDELTNKFTFPTKACTKHKMLYRELNDFHDNLAQHQYLEMNILFPKAIDLENQLLHS